MARINIEDQFFLDVASVAAKMGDVDRATGQALRLIRYAQEKWKSGEDFTLREFKEKFSELLIPEFARLLEGNLIEVAGAAKHFRWLEKKKRAGSKGGKSRSSAKLQHLKQYKDAEATPKQTEAKASKTEASSSSSFSSSSNPPIVPRLGDVSFQPKERWFSLASDYYCKVVGRNTKVGSHAEKRFLAQIQSLEAMNCLLASIENYAEELDLPGNSWRQAKTTFANYLGTERSSFFWRDYVRRTIVDFRGVVPD